MNEEESIKRRIDAVIDEAEKRGFDTIIVTSEVHNQNPANFIYLTGSWVRTSEEHCSLILGVNGQSTLVLPHWGASKMEEQGLYDHVVPTKQEKGHHIHATKAAVEKYYDAKKICFDLSTMSGAFAMHLLKSLNIKPCVERVDPTLIIRLSIAPGTILMLVLHAVGESGVRGVSQRGVSRLLAETNEQRSPQHRGVMNVVLVNGRVAETECIPL